MARVKLKTLREMNDSDLSDKLSDLKADLKVQKVLSKNEQEIYGGCAGTSLV